METQDLHRPKTEWAIQPSSWAAHRDIIEELYLTRGYKLRHVVDIMKTKYGFFATPRMYKLRFKEWGWRKSPRRRLAKQPIDQAPVITDPGLSGKRSGRRAMAAKIRAAPSSELNAYPSPEFALPPQLDAPDTLRHEEGSMRAILLYAQDRLISNAWDLSAAAYDQSLDSGYVWWTDMQCALMILPEDPPLAFDLINTCFVGLPQVITDSHPALVKATILPLMQFYLAEPRLGTLFLRYVSEMSAVKLGGTHPYTRLFAHLDQLGLLQACQAAASLMPVFLKFINDTAARGSDFWISSHFETLRHLVTNSMVQVELANRTAMDITMDALSRQPSADNHELIDWMAIYRMKTLIVGGKCEQGLSLLDAYTLNVHSDGMRDYLWDCKGAALEGLGRHKEATTWFEGCLIRDYEPGLCHIERLIRLRNNYRLTHNKGLADAVHMRATKAWTALADEIKTRYTPKVTEKLDR
ncbi:Clr5 domain-containing protein [Xylariales sp. PMI_506]|nr:Clr5 domain-containing protein [Xylariales sp. PMI_506]